MNRRTLGFPLPAGVALAGCAPLGSPGSLSKGAFAYVCNNDVGRSDAACNGSSLFNSSMDVPASIAVGAHFDLQCGAVFGSNAPIVTALDPAAPSLLQADASSDVSATGFHFAAPATVAVLARAADGTVVDFVHATGVALDHLTLQSPVGQSVTTLQVPAGGAALSALPQDSNGQQLAGEVDYTWSSSDQSVANVQGGGGNVTIVAVAAGKATITVEGLGKQATVDVTVSGGM